MCKRPFTGIHINQINPDTGKNIFLLVSSEYTIDFAQSIKLLKIPSINNLILKYMQSDSHKYVLPSDILDVIPVPCGSCMECRLLYSRMWADRCMLEAQNFTQNCWLTLTYDDVHCPSVCNEDGEVERYTLNPRDFTLFMKRLRADFQRKYGYDNVRFFACGEYGSTTERPHYHVLCFNLAIPDLQFKFNNLGNAFYTSKILEDIWGKGFVVIGDVTWDTCAYTARYILKKQKGKGASDYYENLGIEPEFVRMSRRPGIARAYFEENKDKIYENDNLIIPGKGKARVVRPCKYYDNLYAFENPEFMQKLTLQRADSSKTRRKQILSKTSMDERSYNELSERSLENRLKTLVRPLE